MASPLKYRVTNSAASRSDIWVACTYAIMEKMKFSVSLWRPENVHGFSILGCGNLSWDWANVYCYYYGGVCSGYYYILLGPASATGWCSKNWGTNAGDLSSTLSLLLL